MSGMRNKPNGLARVRLPRDDGDGSYDMQGCYVTTVHTDAEGFWVIEPSLSFKVREPVQGRNGGAMPGDIATVGSMHDDLLEPIREVGDGERSEETLFQPDLPVRWREAAS